jgi:hypothetical protein
VSIVLSNVVIVSKNKMMAIIASLAKEVPQMETVSRDLGEFLIFFSSGDSH